MGEGQSSADHSTPAELAEFRAQHRRASPNYTIYLGFGKDLAAGRSKERSLVLVKVRLGDQGRRDWRPGLPA